MLKRAVSFLRCRKGVAATEFALSLPLLIFILLGTIEYSNYALVTRRAEFGAHFFTEYLSRDPDNVLTDTERGIAQNSWAFAYPNHTDPYGDRLFALSRTHAYGYASINFEKSNPNCMGSGCALEPNVLWSFYGGSYRGIEGSRVACDLTVTEDDVPVTAENFPEGMIGRGAVIMTTVKYRYDSLLGAKLIPTREWEITSVRKTRSGMKLEFPVQRLRDTGHIQDC